MEKESFLKEFEKIKSECCDYLSSQTYYDCSHMLSRVLEEVDPLIQFEKPRVMIYGIYNAGKSTLINALCKNEVAEMGAAPTTAQVKEYEPEDCDYVLIDSPGVDAPIEHEKITEDNLSKCHVILFVMSNKGIFEDKSNYKRMIELIDKNIPFIIVLNEKDDNYRIHKDDTEEEKNRKLQAREKEKKDVRYKIIENLKKYSGRESIHDEYEIIEINAKSGLKGVIDGKAKLYEKSKVGELDARIRQLLSSEKQLRIFHQPLNNMLSILGEITAVLFKQRTGINQEGFEDSIQTMLMMKNNVMESMRIYTKQIVYGHADEVARIIRDENNAAYSEVKKFILDEIEAHFVSRVNELAYFINSNFSEMGIDVDSKASFMSEKKSEGKDEKFSLPIIEKNEIKQPVFDIKPAESSSKSSSIIDLIGSLFSSKSKKEEEEFNRMQNEAQAANENARHWMEEQVRVIQDSKQKSLALLDELQRTLITQVNYALSNKFDEVTEQIRMKNQIETGNATKIDKMISEINGYENRFNVLADKIL
ncbi:MAG: hypothetical protein E7265_02865 [Lachnospiraceae bacterium]|nr:hypothetical protein [Lachnospiraceae bacterium]